MIRVILKTAMVACAFASAPLSAQEQPLGTTATVFLACPDPGQLANALDNVVNEMQIYNSSDDIMRSGRRCYEEDPGWVMKAWQVGWYYIDNSQHDRPSFWVWIDRVEYAPKPGEKQTALGGLLVKNRVAFRPVDIYRASQWALPRWCERNWTELKDSGRNIRLYGTDRRLVLDGCDERSIQFVGSEYSGSARDGRVP